jgi:histidyl-tRNA synthetase
LRHPERDFRALARSLPPLRIRRMGRTDSRTDRALPEKKRAEIVAQLFNFTDKGEREVSLRPELTPTLARVVAAHEREFRKPLKWFSIAQCFRYEKQQRGRLREHFQLNCDVIGEASLAADIELIALSIDLLRSFGFTEKDFVVRVSDREFWSDFLREHAVPEERWSELLQAIDKSEREPPEKTAQRLGALAAPVQKVLESGGSSERLEQLATDLSARGLTDFVKIDLSVVRGLAYYTGIVFELFDRAGKFRALAGGGRYDNLIQQLSDGAVSLPAAGFAMGDVVLGELIQEVADTRARMVASVRQESALDLYLIIAKEERRAAAVAQLQQLREAGWRVDFPLTPAKVGKQFQTAEALGAKATLLYGDEWPSVKIKTLATRDEQLVPNGEVVPHIQSLLST